MEKQKRFIEPGTPQPDAKYYIEIIPQGPYLVCGNPPIRQEILCLNEEQIPWNYTPGNTYATTDGHPTALCRCGHSKNHPYCDGSHANIPWDSTLTADNAPLIENSELCDGTTVVLVDNPKFCANARICNAKGGIWDLVKNSDNRQDRDNIIHESTYCPAGRLKIWDKEYETYFEPPLEPAIGLIEDPQKNCSGPLWVQGGIPINGPNNLAYEQRNRVTLCRCGVSSNKPFCDGSHVANQFQDHLPLNTDGEEKI